MPETTNFNIPFLDGTELVRDYPTFSEDLANAVDDGLSGGFRFVETVYFTSNGTFSKGDFPFLRAVRVKCQGGGGGGGGSAGISNRRCGAGGGGGGYAESFITNIVGLASSVTVTRGAGGAGGVGDVDGSPGGASSFGSLVVGNGGNNAFSQGGRRAGAASGGSGDAVFVGGAGHQVNFVDSNPGGNGGSSFLGQGGRGRDFIGVATGGFGSNFGGGGGGCFASTGGPQNGGDGADGIVIVELFA